MENQINNPQSQGPYNSKTVAGLIVLGLGVLFLLKSLDFFLFPHWIFSWPMLLIAVAIFTGAKHNFRKKQLAGFISRRFCIFIA